MSAKGLIARPYKYRISAHFRRLVHKGQISSGLFVLLVYSEPGCSQFL